MAEPVLLTPSRSSRANVRPILAGLFAVALWAALPTLVKLGLEDIPVSYFLVLRFAIASVLFVPFAVPLRRKLKQVPLRHWIYLTIILTGNYLLQTLALSELPASWYIVIFSLSPLLSLGAMKVALSRRSKFGIGLSLLGTVFFLDASHLLTHVSWVALAAMVGGMITWALYAPAVKIFQKVFSDLEIVAVTNILPFAPILLVWLSEGRQAPALSSIALLAVIVTGLFVPLAYLAFLYCLRRLPVFGVTSQYLEPVLGLLIAFIVLNERFSTRELLGGAIVIVGVTCIRD